MATARSGEGGGDREQERGRERTGRAGETGNRHGTATGEAGESGGGKEAKGGGGGGKRPLVGSDQTK